MGSCLSGAKKIQTNFIEKQLSDHGPSGVNIKIPQSLVETRTPQSIERDRKRKQRNRIACMRCDKCFSLSRKPVLICPSHNICFMCLYDLVRNAQLVHCLICYRDVNFNSFVLNERLLAREGLIPSQIEQQQSPDPHQIPSDVGLRQTFYGIDFYRDQKQYLRRNILEEAFKAPPLIKAMTERIPFADIKVLNLSSCNLAVIPIFSAFSCLEILQMAHNEIQKIDIMEELPLLIDLDLSSNQIKVLENLNLPSLLYLWVNLNLVEEVPNIKQWTKKWLPKLKSLSLEKNPINFDFKKKVSEQGLSFKVFLS